MVMPLEKIKSFLNTNYTVVCKQLAAESGAVVPGLFVALAQIELSKGY